MNTKRKLVCKTFTKKFEGKETKDVQRATARKDVLTFVNDEVGEENFVSLTECRSEDYWDCTVWFWKNQDVQG